MTKRRVGRLAKARQGVVVSPKRGLVARGGQVADNKALRQGLVRPMNSAHPVSEETRGRGFPRRPSVRVPAGSSSGYVGRCLS